MDKAKELDAMKMLLRGVTHKAIHAALRALYGRSIGSSRLVGLGEQIKKRNLNAEQLDRSRVTLWDDGTWRYG